MGPFTFAVVLLGCSLLVQADKDDTLGSHFDGACPEIPPVIDENEEPKENEVWYTLHTSYGAFKTMRCVTSNSSRENATRTHVDSVFLNETGHRIQFHSDLDKVSPGHYISSFVPENSNETLRCNVVTIKDHPEHRGVLAWGCKNFDNGTHVESASIYSNQRTTSDELLTKFKNYLKDYGAKIVNLYKIDHDNCPEHI